MRIATLVPATSAWGKLVVKYKKDTEKFCEGSLEIELLLGGQIGTEAEMIEMVQKGDLEAAAVTAGSVARVVPELKILEVPYLFRDVDEARMLTDKVIAPSLVRKLSSKQLFGTAMFDNGFRNFIAKKFIRTPSDLNGLKIASDDTDIQMAFWKALGVTAAATPMDGMDSVLRKGEANCADNSLIGVFSLNMYMKTKYITESEHGYQAALVVLNNDWWESLPIDLKLKLLKQNSIIVSEMREVSK
ncbi:MAG: TRAP transporter substrate-binding protein, partial [bacterium]